MSKHPKTLRSYFCWLLGHKWLCLFRHKWDHEFGRCPSESTGWTCAHCNKSRHEEWDS